MFYLIQLLNAVQYGMLLFLLSSGLTLIFGIMGVINLAHGSFYMIGAYLAYWLAQWTGSLWLALPLAILMRGGTWTPLTATVCRAWSPEPPQLMRLAAATTTRNVAPTRPAGFMPRFKHTALGCRKEKGRFQRAPAIDNSVGKGIIGAESLSTGSPGSGHRRPGGGSTCGR